MITKECKFLICERRIDQWQRRLLSLLKRWTFWTSPRPINCSGECLVILWKTYQHWCEKRFFLILCGSIVKSHILVLWGVEYISYCCAKNIEMVNICKSCRKTFIATFPRGPQCILERLLCFLSRRRFLQQFY